MVAIMWGRSYGGENEVKDGSEVAMTGNQDETARRRRVEQADHSGRMEGLTLSDEARRAATAYAAGDIDSAELVKQMRGRYGHD